MSIFKALSFWSSVGLSLVVLVIYVLSRPEINLIPASSILEIIEAKTLDLRFRLRGEITPGDDIIIIEIDEKTEDELGRWQSQGRQWLAKLLHILHESKAKIVGFDLTLAEPEEGKDLKILEELETRYLKHLPSENINCPEILSYLNQAKSTYDYDLQLTNAIQQAGNVVLGIYHFFEPESVTHLTPEKHTAYRQLINRVAYTAIQFPAGTIPQPLQVYHSFGVEPNLPAFSEAAKSFGHFDVVPDRDGAIRFTPLLVEYAGDYYPSLALEVARWYLNPPLPPIVHALGKEGAGSLDTIELGDTFIPCDEQSKLLINYYGPVRSFPYYSLSDVILGKVPSRFEDKIVLLGFTSLISQDLHSVPFQPDTYPGVEINATIIENIIRQDFLIRPKWTTLAEASLIFLLGILLGVVQQRESPLRGMWVVLICLLIVSGFAHIAFLFGKIWLNVTFPLFFIIVDYLAITSYKYFIEERQKRGIKNAFQHYVSPTIVEHLLKTVDKLKLGGERKHLTALFSDIRGFTQIAEQMSPEDLVGFLNEYFSEMTEIILDYGGTVDKYMGDGIMAFYGAPLEQAEHAMWACKTAAGMILRLKELCGSWEARGLPPINIGIGINSGEMTVGNVGSWERFDYTVIGDNVNLASRLEKLNKEYGTNIIISQFTYQCIRDDSFTVRELDTVQIKGKDEPVIIYELFGDRMLYSQKQHLITAFSKGLQAYKNRQWTQAIIFFQEALQIDPHDRPSRIYIERCARYYRNPPPENWDGVFVTKTT